MKDPNFRIGFNRYMEKNNFRFTEDQVAAIKYLFIM